MFLNVSPVFALELNYPSIPGLGKLSDYEKLPSDQQLGFVVSYIYKLVFFIVLGVGLAVLLASGFLYIVSSSRPQLLATAKEMASNALLGIFILMISYLVLYLINPQLLSLTFKKPNLTIESYQGETPPPNAITLQAVPLSEELKKITQDLTEKIYSLDNGEYYYEKFDMETILAPAKADTTLTSDQIQKKIDTAKNQFKDCIDDDQMVFCLSNGYGALATEKSKGREVLTFEDRKRMANLGCICSHKLSVIKSDSKILFRPQLQIEETAEILNKISNILKDEKDAKGNIVKKGLESLLAECQCGNAKWHIQDFASRNPQCKPGLQPDTTEYKEALKKGGIPYTQCDDVGTKVDAQGALLCDLRDVRKIKNDKGEYEYQVCTKGRKGQCEQNDSCWVYFNPDETVSIQFSDKNNCSEGPVKRAVIPRLIKLKTLQILELYNQLEARTRLTTNFLDNLTLVGKALDTNKMDFVISNAQGLWGYDAANQIEEWQKTHPVVIEKAQSALETQPGLETPNQETTAHNQPKHTGFTAKIKKLFAPLSSFFASRFPFFASAFQEEAPADYSPATFFYVIDAPPDVLPEEVLEKNKNVWRDAQRFKLFNVLTNLSLEDVDAIFQQCLNSAFGSAQYAISKEQLEALIEKAKKEGLLDHLEKVAQEKINEASAYFANGFEQAASNDIKLAYIKKFFDQCQGYGECTSETVLDIANKIEQNKCGDTLKSALNNTCCYCVMNLMKNKIPPRFVSNTLTKILTENIGKAFPNIQKILQTKTKDVLFPPNRKIGDFLDDDMGKVYNRILQGALTQPFSQLIPGLNELLEKPMKEVLPRFVAQNLESLNNWFANTIKSTKSLLGKYSEGYARSLAEQYIIKPLHQWADEQFDKMGIGVKNLTIGECYKWLENGYIYEVDQRQIDEYNTGIENGTINSLGANEPGQCRKMTPEEITGLSKAPIGFTYSQTELGKIKITGVQEQEIKSKFRETICKGAGYSWGKSGIIKRSESQNEEWNFSFTNLPNIEEGEGICYENSNISRDLQGAIETIRDKKKLSTWMKTGLINYAEQLGVALTQTALHMALEYARVYVEDNFLAPLMVYWNKIVGFQQMLQNFLSASVKDVLPDQIADFLQSNIRNELKNFCTKYNNALTALKTNPNNADYKCNNGWIKVSDFVLDLPNDKNIDFTTEWKDQPKIKKDFCVNPKIGNKLCQLEEHLEQTVFEELTYYTCNNRYAQDSAWQEKCQSVVNALNDQLGNVLSQICYTDSEGKEYCFDINNWLNKSLAEILFPKIKNINDLIKTSPKDLMCGKNLTIDNTTVAPIINRGNKQSVEEQCKQIFQNQFALIPRINQEKIEQLKLGDFVPWCFFIDYACQNPATLALGSQTTIGGFLKQTIINTCNLLDKQSIKQCSSKAGDCFCPYDCPKESITGNQNCSEQATACQLCNALAQNSIFYTLLSEAVRDVPLNKRTPEQKKNEIEFYAQMANDFPELTNDIQQLAKQRGINWQIEVAPLILQQTKDAIKALLSGDISEKMKSLIYILHTNQAAGTNWSFREMLLGYRNGIFNQTLYQFLKNNVCAKVIEDFESAFPDFAFDNVKAENLDKIRTALPYSMESVQSFTLADQIRIIANSGKEGAEEYVLCKILDNTPQEIFGLDQSLRNYIRPKEYVILFDLLANELSPGSPTDCRKNEQFYVKNGQAMCCDKTFIPSGSGKGLCYNVGERPASLNQFIDYMLDNNPVSALRDLQQSMPDSQTYSFVLYTSEKEEGCANEQFAVNKPIASCLLSSAIEQLNELGANINPNSKFAPTDNSVIITIDNKEFKPFASFTSNNKYYYFIKPDAENKDKIILVFESPNTTKAQFGEFLDFMQTPLGTLLDQAVGKQTIVEIICDSFKDDQQNTICDLGINAQININNIRQKIVEFLRKKPVDLLEIYLKNPLSLQPSGQAQNKNQSLMDLLSANTMLGQPLTDTIFRMLGLEQSLQQLVDIGKQKTQWIDAGAVKVVEKVQDGLETALVDWPKQAGRYLAGLLGFSIGEKTAADVAGRACYELPAGQNCKPGEILRQNNGKNECCLLAKAQACTPRCRKVDRWTTACNTFIGEEAEPTTGRNGTKMCCLKLNNEKQKCQRCRAVNSQAGGKCIEKDDNGQNYETKNGDFCCSFEEYTASSNIAPPGSEDEDIQNAGFCCVPVEKCISTHFAGHLENIAEMMADGKIPLRSLKEK